MNKKLINVEYFKRGLKINILQVGASLIIGFTTSIIYYSNLSGIDFVVYSVIQLTVYFFVNFFASTHVEILTPIASNGNGEELN